MTSFQGNGTAIVGGNGPPDYTLLDKLLVDITLVTFVVIVGDSLILLMRVEGTVRGSDVEGFEVAAKKDTVCW